MNAKPLNTLMEPLSIFWLERNPRERNMLVVAALALTLALLYLLLISPALAGRERLQKNLPPLRQQAAELQALAKQAGDLVNTPPPPATPVTRDSLEASLTRRGLKPQSLVLSGELAKVQLQSASFAALVSWLDDMQKTARLSLVEASFEALPAIDNVNATLTLRQQRNDKKDE